MDELRKLLIDFKKRLEKLETRTFLRIVTFPDNEGVLRVPKYATDPTSPTNGDIWYNTTSQTFKCYRNGAVRTFTTT